jgi:hypothetical protein
MQIGNEKDRPIPDLAYRPANGRNRRLADVNRAIRECSELPFAVLHSGSEVRPGRVGTGRSRLVAPVEE